MSQTKNFIDLKKKIFLKYEKFSGRGCGEGVWGRCYTSIAEKITFDAKGSLEMQKKWLKIKWATL